MTITADRATCNGRLRASSNTQPPALTPPLVVPLQAPRARSGARAPAATRAGGRARSEAAPRGHDARLMMLQRPQWSLLCEQDFRLEVSGWERLPAETSQLVGVHSGGAFTIDAWTLVAERYRRFGDRRIVYPIAHDVLMAAPGLGYYLRANGVLRALREPVSGVLAAGRDVIVWPGGEQDAMRSWRKRDQRCSRGAPGSVWPRVGSVRCSGRGARRCRL